MRLKLTKTAVDKLTAQPKPYDVYDTELAGLVFRVEPSGSRTFYLAYRVAGNRRRYKIGRYPGVTVDGARKIAQAKAGQVASGVDPQGERERERAQSQRERVSTLGAFLKFKYEPWAASHLKTAQVQLQRIRADFASWIDKPMSMLSPFLVEGWRRAELKRGKKPVTVNRDLQRLRAVLGKAVEWGVITQNPMAGVKPLRTDRRGRVRFLSANEEAALRAALLDRETSLRAARDRFNSWRRARGLAELPRRDGEFVDHMRPMVLLALNTGMRRGELLSLQWRNVNLAAESITVLAENAKSGQTRYLPLNMEALDLLESWRGCCTNTEATDYVFTVAKGRRMTTVSNAWESVVKRAALSDFRFHDTRHHFASRLVMAGVPLNTVRELLGHTSIEMTLRYAHLAPDNLVAAVEKVAV